MGARKTKKPAAPGGAKLHAFFMKKFGSLAAAARAANLPELTVSRYVYSPPKRPQLHVVEALQKIGAERDWLVPVAVEA